MSLSLTSKICNGFLTTGLRLLSSRNYMMQVPMAVQTPVSNGLAPSGLPRLLAPFNSLLTQVAGFKVKARLKRRCKDCYIVIRQERHYVICPTHPRHKQMSMKKRDYKSWILTHATQSKERPY